MSRRKRPVVFKSFFSESVRGRTLSNSSTVLRRWLNCQRQSFHLSSGTSAYSAARFEIKGVLIGFSSGCNSQTIKAVQARGTEDRGVDRGLDDRTRQNMGSF